MGEKSSQAILEKYEPKRENLMPILHDVNDACGYISEEAMQDIADYVDVSATEVYGTASFYSFFNLTKKGTYVIRVCQSLSCDMAGKDEIIKTLEKELRISMGETTADGMFSLERTNCMGMCDVGPAMLVNKDIHTQVTPTMVKAVIAGLKKGGR